MKGIIVTNRRLQLGFMQTLLPRQVAAYSSWPLTNQPCAMGDYATAFKARSTAKGLALLNELCLTNLADPGHPLVVWPTHVVFTPKKGRDGRTLERATASTIAGHLGFEPASVTSTNRDRPFSPAPTSKQCFVMRDADEAQLAYYPGFLFGSFSASNYLTRLTIMHSNSMNSRARSLVKSLTALKVTYVVKPESLIAAIPWDDQLEALQSRPAQFRKLTTKRLLALDAQIRPLLDRFRGTGLTYEVTDR